MIKLLSFIIVFVLSWLSVGAFVRWSMSRSILDVPNDRSSHVTPTPVGGGIVIVIITIVCMVLFEVLAGNGLRFWGFYVGGAAIALVSWFDDVRPVPAVFRLLVHISAALVAVIQIGSFEVFNTFGGHAFNLGIGGSFITVVWIVGLTNAYNFMDGIDGLAGLQGVLAAGGWAIFASFFGMEALSFVSVVIFASTLGFLVHNWPPARVFMGDVGSAFLGYTFAVLPLIALSYTKSAGLRGFIPIAAIGIVWIFVADTLLTMLRRLLAGEKIWSAHRRHFYQELIKNGFTHLSVTCFYGILMLVVGISVQIESNSAARGIVIGTCLILLVLFPMSVFVTKRLT